MDGANALDQPDLCSAFILTAPLPISTHCQRSLVKTALTHEAWVRLLVAYSRLRYPD